MKYTNIYGLPSSIVNAITNDPYDKGSADFSATELLKPPQITHLYKIHEDKLSTDVSDEVWKLLGSGVHAILERAHEGGDDVVIEERLFADMDGYTISGAMDLRDRHRITDYKVTASYKIQKGDFEEWEKQLNIYAWLARQNGFDEINELEIVAMLRDWKKSRKWDREYPDAPIVRIPIVKWLPEKQEEFIRERIALHTADTPQECSKEETWNGIRCRDWCPVSEFCPQYKSDF